MQVQNKSLELNSNGCFFRNHDITVLLKRNDVFYNRPVIVKPKFECENVSNMDHVHFQTLVVWSLNLFFLWRIRFHFFECIVPNPNPNLFIFLVHAVNSSIGMHVYFLTAHNKAILAHKDHGLNIISDFESDSFTFSLGNALKPSPFRLKTICLFYVSLTWNYFEKSCDVSWQTFFLLRRVKILILTVIGLYCLQ